LFDENTPEPYKKRIESYKTLMPQFHSRFCSSEEAADFHHSDDNRNCRFIREEIASLLENDEEFVLTTNVDNDDAIHREMLQTLQTQFLASPKETLYSLNIGLQYFPRLHVAMHMRYPHNHFLTLTERTDKDFRTVMFYGHTKARKLLPTVDILGKPYWLEVVHSCNVNNDLRITSRIRYRCLWKSYSLQEYGLPLHFSFSSNLVNNLFYLPLYFCKVGIWRLKRKVRICFGR
ncbi:glycosyltransferase, partial [uncultured Bacteroides sp.]